MAISGEEDGVPDLRPPQARDHYVAVHYRIPFDSARPRSMLNAAIAALVGAPIASRAWGRKKGCEGLLFYFDTAKDARAAANKVRALRTGATAHRTAADAW